MHETSRQAGDLSAHADRSRATARLLAEAHASGEEQRGRLLQEVVLVNRPVARAIASRYRGRGVSTQDLEQIAYEGLVKAVHRFDPSVRSDLLTYAVPTIRGEITRHFRDHGWMVRPPRRIQEMQWQITRSTERLSSELGRTPTDAEISVDLGCDEAAVSEALRAFGSFNPVSLDRPLLDSSDLTLADTLTTDDQAALDVAEARAGLGPALRQLDARDRRILFMRFFEDKTQAEIGQTLGITQMQVSRLLTRILRELRGELAA
jgi:RNA polymerase sigma-B factor